MGFYTNHSSSEHTFPRNRSAPDASADESTKPSIDDAPAPAGSHSAVEEIIEEEDRLAWEGFMSPMED